MQTFTLEYLYVTQKPQVLYAKNLKVLPILNKIDLSYKN